MPDEKQDAGPVSEPAPTTPAAESQQEQPATPNNETVATTPANTENEKKGESSAQNDVSHEEQKVEETVRRLLEPHNATLQQEGKPSSEIIREVLQALHEQDANVLNSDLYPEIKYQIAKKLKVTKTLVDNNKKTVLKQIVDKSSDEPVFPAGPKGSESKQPEAPAAPATGGAPFGGVGPAVNVFQNNEETAGQPPADLAKWTDEQVKFIFRFAFRGINRIAKDWDLLTPEEEKDLGKLLPPIFDKIFPTSADNQNYAMLLVVMLSVFGPRLQKTVGPWMAARKGKGSNPNSGGAATQ